MDRRAFSKLPVPGWMKEMLSNSQPILLALEEKIRALTRQLEAAAEPGQPRGFGKLTSVVIDREVGQWQRFGSRRRVSSYTGLCPGEASSGDTRLQTCVTKHGNPRVRAALVEAAWRLVRFQPNYLPVRKWRRDPGQGRSGHRSRAQKSHRRRRASARSRSLAYPNRTRSTRTTGTNHLKLMSSRGTDRKDLPNAFHM